MCVWGGLYVCLSVDVCACTHLGLCVGNPTPPHVNMTTLTCQPTRTHVHTDANLPPPVLARAQAPVCTDTLTHTSPRAHTSAQARLPAAPPGRPALPARGTSWPPAPSSILSASLSLVSPYPSHLLISLLDSRRRCGSCGRGEMDGPGGVGAGERCLESTELRAPQSRGQPGSRSCRAPGVGRGRPPSRPVRPQVLSALYGASRSRPRDPRARPWAHPCPGTCSLCARPWTCCPG